MGHSHSHSHSDHGRAFGWSVGLNLLIVLVEAAAGVWVGSLALLADAAHNLGDVLGLLMAWGASRLGQVKSTPRYTFGLRRTSILAALFNALLLLAGTGGLMWEAVTRLQEGTAPPSQPLVIVAVALLGVLINFGSAMLFAGHGGDVNLRGAFLHLMSDAVVALAVVVSGAVVYYTGWSAVDPVTTLVVGVSIVMGTWGLFKESLALSLDAVPSGIEPDQVEDYLCQLDGVESVHELHIWPLGSSHTALSVHLVRPQGLDDAFLERVTKELHEKFQIFHSTIQLEEGRIHCHCGQAHDHDHEH